MLRPTNNNNKYPALSIIERVDSSSDEMARNTPFPIASISKSFCGAVCALMALDGEFGGKGIDATLQEVLELAKSKPGANLEEISKYQEMLIARGFIDVKLSELLTHRSGCRDADEVAPSTYVGMAPIDFFSRHLGRGEGLESPPCERGKHRYSNVGYGLLEEIINLASSKGSYRQELQDRVLTRLELGNTGVLEDTTDQKAAEAKLHLGVGVFIPGSKEGPHSDKIVEVKTSFPANYTTPLGAVSTSCGGLYSSVEDLEKFSTELAKMVAGQENLLTDDPQTASIIYRSQLSDSHNYSLGIEFQQSEKGCVMSHSGLFPGNFAVMQALLPCNYDDLKSEREISPAEIKTEIRLQKFDYLVSSLFTEQADAIPKALIKEFILSQLSENEKLHFNHMPIGEAEKYLIENDRLPKNFSEICKEISTAFEPGRELVKAFLKEGYLNEKGVIDSEKIAQDFPTTREVDAVLEPIFYEGREFAARAFTALTKTDDKPSASPSPVGVVESLADQSIVR